MILAHKNITQLVRLATLLSKGFDCFVHIDLKANLSKADLILLDSLPKNVYLVSNRVAVEIAHYSMIIAVEEIFNLIKKISELNNSSYGYLLLISGQDYPIKKIAEIKSILNSNFPLPILDLHTYDETSWARSVFSRYRFMKLHNLIEKSSDFRPLQKIFKVPLYMVEILYTIINQDPYKRLVKAGLYLRVGSAWWGLSFDILDKVFNYLRENPKIRNVYENLLAPEEHLFQTIVSLIIDDDEFYRFKNSRVQLTKSFFDHPIHGLSKTATLS